jgi:NADPH-dependent curcumin reductase CurA
MRACLEQRLGPRQEGVILDHWDRYSNFRQQMTEWVRDGQVKKYRVDVVEGPGPHLRRSLSCWKGRNFGKLLVKVDWYSARGFHRLLWGQRTGPSE